MSEVFTNLKVTPLKNQDNAIKASGVVTVANVLEVRFTIASGKNGLWVKLPSHQFKFKNKETGQEETKWARDVKIVDEELYKSFQELVISEYNKTVGSPGEGSQQRPARDNRNF